MKNSFVAAFLSIVLLSSCHFIHSERFDGNGNVITQARSVRDFKGVEVSGGIDIYVTQDSAYSVKVEADENLQELIEVFEEDGILKIRQRNNTSLNSSRQIKAYVSAPMLRHFGASGACKIQSSNQFVATEEVDIDMSGACEAELDIKAPAIEVSASGACKIKLKGQTRDFKIDGSGSTDVRAFELLSENASIDMSGSGDVEVYASVKLKAKASGSTDVKYKGNASVDSDVSGAGSVKKVE